MSITRAKATRVAVATLATESTDAVTLAADDCALEGSLTELSVADVLQMLHELKKTGALVLGNGDISATIVLADGQIVGCRHPNSVFCGGNEVDLTALAELTEATIVEVLHWQQGRFVFEVDKRLGCDGPVIDGVGGLSTTRVLLNAMSHMDEQQAAPFPSPLEEALATAVSPDPDVWSEIEETKRPGRRVAYDNGLTSLIAWFARMALSIRQTTAGTTARQRWIALAAGLGVLIAVLTAAWASSSRGAGATAARPASALAATPAVATPVPLSPIPRASTQKHSTPMAAKRPAPHQSKAAAAAISRLSAELNSPPARAQRTTTASATSH